MRAVGLAAMCATLACTSPAAIAQAPQDAVEFQQQAVRREYDWVKVGFSVKNLTDGLLKHVAVQCVALDASGTVTDTSSLLVENVRKNEKAYGFVALMNTHDTKLNFQCRVSNVYPSD